MLKLISQAGVRGYEPPPRLSSKESKFPSIGIFLSSFNRKQKQEGIHINFWTDNNNNPRKEQCNSFSIMFNRKEKESAFRTFTSKSLSIIKNHVPA